ncbi:MAG: superoxide dismutase, Ni [Pseudomonadota bacterium]
MISTLRRVAERFGFVIHARGHCDIPCGIYDTGPAIYHAASVLRLIDQFNEAGNDDFLKRSRLVADKENQAEKVKHEVRVIWGDYFKSQHIEAHPEIHDLTHAIMQQASKCKQGASREDGVTLVELLNSFAEIFWQTKGVQTARGTSPYEPKISVVYPVLSD